MEQQTKDRYSDAILQAAMDLYGIAKDQIRPLDAFESFIYEFERGSHAFILRISHSLRRSEALIQGEVDWINYLAEGGISVARAIPAKSGKLVEAVEDGQGGSFLIAAFVKAEGMRPWEMWTPSLFEAYGRLLGSIHARTEGYQPSEPAWRRPAWDDDMFNFVKNHLPASESLTKEKYRSLREYLQGLPKDGTSYGLIHQDAHGANFFVDEAGILTLFDFDDCAYSWFVNDIAIALFYIVMGREDPPAFTQEFMTCFLRGYRQVRSLEPKWLKEISYFLKLREMELYAVIHRDFDVSNIDDPWCDRFMRDRKYKIEHDVPYIDFDFGSLSVYVGSS